MSKVQTLCSEFWQWRMESSPEFASYCGDHRYDDKLDDVSLEGFKSRFLAAEEFLSKAELLSQEVDPTTDDYFTLDLLKDQLITYCKNYEYNGFAFSVSRMDGIHVFFEQLLDYMIFDKMDDYEKYVARLGCLPKRIAESQALMKFGIDNGLTHHRLAMDGVQSSLESFEINPQETIFFKPFKEIKESIDNSLLKPFEEQALEIIQHKIQPAFQEFKIFIKEEYSKHLRSNEGIFSVPNGTQFYQACLDWHLSIHLTPKEVHDIGWKEIERIEKEMKEILLVTKFDGDLKSFCNYLRNENSFYFNSKNDLLNGFRDLCENKIRPVLTNLFYNIPKSQLIIESSSQPTTPGAFYIAGTLDGSRPGRFYVNASNLKTVPKYEMMTLSLHEGEPGHHFQGMYAIEKTNVEQFQQYIEDMNYNLVPSRFPVYTSYCEGWGLYCEYLGNELGLYDDPYVRFGHLSFEMHRACRLVIDTGIHAYGWTYEKALKLLLEKSAVSENFACSELKRYISWPGQACAYKIGQMKIKDLRQKATDALGKNFNVKDFHEVILSALNVSLNILEELINKYIENNLNK